MPINMRPYRLPESQKEETEKQVTNLLKEGIIVESRFPPSRATLLMPVSLACKIAEALYPLHPEQIESLPILTMLMSRGGPLLHKTVNMSVVGAK